MNARDKVQAAGAIGTLQRHFLELGGWVLSAAAAAAAPQVTNDDDDLGAGETQEDPIERLATAVMVACVMCAQPFTDVVKERCADEQAANVQQVRLQYEFQFGFLHLTLRVALQLLGDPLRGVLMDRVAERLANETEKLLFAHWPEDARASIRREFFHNASEAELQYASCPTLVDAGDPYAGPGVFSMLARNVAALFDRQKDPEVLRVVLDLSLEKWREVNAEQLIRATGSALSLSYATGADTAANAQIDSSTTLDRSGSLPTVPISASEEEATKTQAQSPPGSGEGVNVVDEVATWMAPGVAVRPVTAYEIKRPGLLGSSHTRGFFRTSMLTKAGRRKSLLEVFTMLEDKATLYDSVAALKQDVDELVQGFHQMGWICQEVSHEVIDQHLAARRGAPSRSVTHEHR